MFSVRSCDASESMDNKSSGDTPVEVTDNFSILAKPRSGTESGRRMSVNETSTRLMFGTSGIKTLIDASESDVWRSFNVRRAGSENPFSVSKLERSCANVVSVCRHLSVCAWLEQGT